MMRQTEIGRNWFSNRVVDDWNRLTSHVVSAESLDSFKRRLDKFMDRDDRWSIDYQGVTGPTTCRPAGLL